MEKLDRAEGEKLVRETLKGRTIREVIVVGDLVRVEVQDPGQRLDTVELYPDRIEVGLDGLRERYMFEVDRTKMHRCWAGCGRPVIGDGHVVNLDKTTLHMHEGDCEEKFNCFWAAGGVCMECGVTPPDKHADWCPVGQAQ